MAINSVYVNFTLFFPMVLFFIFLQKDNKRLGVASVSSKLDTKRRRRRFDGTGKGGFTNRECWHPPK